MVWWMKKSCFSFCIGFQEPQSGWVGVYALRYESVDEEEFWTPRSRAERSSQSDSQSKSCSSEEGVETHADTDRVSEPESARQEPAPNPISSSDESEPREYQAASV